MEAAKKNQSPRTSPSSTDSVAKELNLYFKYLLIRDGFRPLSSMADKEKVLDQYQEDYNNVRRNNLQLAAGMPESCQRFLNLYDKTNQQQLYYYNHLVLGTKPEMEPLVKARLEILRSIHMQLHDLMIRESEGGYSDIDRTAHESCVLQDRPRWVRVMSKNSGSMSLAHAAIVGEISKISPFTLKSRVHSEKVDQEQEFMAKNGAFLLGEFAAATTGFTYGVMPTANYAIDKIRAADRISKRFRNSRLMPWFVRFGFSAAYSLAITFYAKNLRKKWTFLQPAPELREEGVVSGWETLMIKGEKFLQSDLDSPILYHKYLEKIDEMNRENAIQFLDQNKLALFQARKKYGTIDAAYEKLKEVEGL